MNKKVTVLGGGTGLSYLLKGLKNFPVDITSVITVSDNGKSTGKLRKEFNTQAVGDIRKVITSLSSKDSTIKQLMEYRFQTSSDLDGHAIGNLILTALLDITGSLDDSIKALSNLLDVNHKVLPISEDSSLTLMCTTEKDELIEGQKEISKSPQKIKKIFYKEEPHVTPEVIEAIKTSDLIIFSMGSLYTSVMPHIICKDVVDAIKKAKAKVMYICNAMTQPGETDGFGVSDHVNVLEQYLGKDAIDVVIASNTVIPKEMLKKYETEEQKDQVPIDYENIIKCKYELLEDDLLTTTDGTIKHNSLKLSSVIFSYLMR